MKTQRRVIGDLGESIACKFLEGKGYVIAERNYLRPEGEIDIVAKKDSELFFIEVKTVRVQERVPHETNDHYRGEENLHKQKLGRLAKVIQIYINDRRFMGNWIFCAIFVEINQRTNKVKIRFLEDIVL